MLRDAGERERGELKAKGRCVLLCKQWENGVRWRGFPRPGGVCDALLVCGIGDEVDDDDDDGLMGMAVGMRNVISVVQCRVFSTDVMCDDVHTPGNGPKTRGKRREG